MTSSYQTQFKSINYTALKPGVRLIVTGAVHGNETCGTTAIPLPWPTPGRLNSPPSVPSVPPWQTSPEATVQTSVPVPSTVVLTARPKTRTVLPTASNFCTRL